MTQPRSIVSALVVAGLLACEPVLEADVISPDFAAAGGGGQVVESVTGSGHLRRPPPVPEGQFRTFSLTARKHADGTVAGEIQGNNHGNFPMFHITISCFTIIGNQAWIGGTFVKSDNPSIVGREARLRVVDNGEGNAASPDQISLISAPAAGSGGAQRQCDRTPDFPRLREIEKGNIQIH